MALISALSLVGLSGMAMPSYAKDTQNYSAHPEAQAFIEKMVGQGFERNMLEQLMADAKRQQSILDAISRPAEKRLNWGQYRKIFLDKQRIEGGAAFWKKHHATLAAAEKKYGVPPEIIVAIIGVETRYGRIMGSYRVLDALATLGFDYPKRSKFFAGQLEHYLHMTKSEGIDPRSLKGSYAGAMGFGQFIPSSFRSYAVDFDNDGKRDIWKNEVDAIGSVANYFAEHGWKKGQPVLSNLTFLKEPQESWFGEGLKPKRTLNEWKELGVSAANRTDLSRKAILLRLEKDDAKRFVFGLDNFYTITRYNHSRLYAMAVYELSQAVKRRYAESS
ncbi:MAG: lytic murein transglycosylase B [Pontibacterium sp.]